VSWPEACEVGVAIGAWSSRDLSPDLSLPGADSTGGRWLQCRSMFVVVRMNGENQLNVILERILLEILI
jgi:hypothetical protein